MKYKVAVIGAGNIAQGYDTKESENVFTHIKAYSLDTNFEIVCIFDKDYNKALEVSKYWNISNVAKNLLDIKKSAPDIISICTPDNTHYQYLITSLSLNPKLVLCEKPLALTVSQAKIITEKYLERNIFLVVNYSRKWVTEFELLKVKIDQGIFGKIISVRIKYYKGFMHNGSHLINLLDYFLLFQDLTGAVIKSINDYSDEDPTITGAYLVDSAMGRLSLLIEGYDHTLFMPLEIEMIFEKVKILIEENNGTWLCHSVLKENESFPGYFEFNEISRVKINMGETMPLLMKNIVNSLNGSENIKSTGNDGLRTLQICQKIKEVPFINYINND